MNDFDIWLEHYTKTRGPVLDLEKMEASVKQWKFDKITKEALADDGSLEYTLSSVPVSHLSQEVFVTPPVGYGWRFKLKGE